MQRPAPRPTPRSTAAVMGGGGWGGANAGQTPAALALEEFVWTLTTLGVTGDDYHLTVQRHNGGQCFTAEQQLRGNCD